jgi:hypothetical protein
MLHKDHSITSIFFLWQLLKCEKFGDCGKVDVDQKLKINTLTTVIVSSIRCITETVESPPPAFARREEKRSWKERKNQQQYTIFI